MRQVYLLLLLDKSKKERGKTVKTEVANRNQKKEEKLSCTYS